MYRRFCFVFAVFLVSIKSQTGIAQCDPFFPAPLSPRLANYDINVTLDDATKTITAVQSIRFTNHSPVPIQELRLYLYLNAFKNTESTFLKGATNIFGQSFADRKPEEWAWVSIDQFRRENGADITQNLRYAHTDDGNPDDQSVLAVALDKPVLPGETAVFHLNWRARMPKTIARAGYSKDFYLFCHWFPQLGVFEQDPSGNWGWNCHQFSRQTEFYADFGVYDVRITAADKFIMGASGCLVEEKNNGNGTTTRHYHAEDVIDFAWSIYPSFRVMEDRWKGVQIRLLYPPEHAAMAPRYLHALKFALQYLDEHVGPYPYPTITVVDPPFHGLRSGLMEYPTLITTGTFYGTPEHLHNSESLVVHEFVHQYFMGMVASNEKEEPWLDEGFVTYFEDRIIDAAYGEKQSLVNVFGYRFDNRELSRLEYTTMRNPREGIVARPGWMFSESNFKALIYSKTATTLRTLQALIGDQRMDALIQSYFQAWKFRHPRGSDFMAHLQKTLQASADSTLARQAYALVETSIYNAQVLDYAVTNISNELLFAPQGVFGDHPQQLTYQDGSGDRQLLAQVEVQRKGDWVYPVEIRVTFEDGSTETVHWLGVEGKKMLEWRNGKRIVSAQVDPGYTLALDVDINNNSMTLEPTSAPLWKYAAKVLFWVQQMMHTISFLG
jgi:Peptidase family M1 domain